MIPKGLAVVLLCGKRKHGSLLVYFSKDRTKKGGTVGTHGSRCAGDNGAVLKMFSVKPLSTFVIDALEKIVIYIYIYILIDKLEQNKKRVHEMECITPKSRKRTLLLYFHH